MIITPEVITQGEIQFKRLKYPDGRLFWIFSWLEGSDIPFKMSTDEGELIPCVDGPKEVEGVEVNAIGMDSQEYTYEDFIRYIHSLNLKTPGITVPSSGNLFTKMVSGLKSLLKIS